jgi:excisionase family DNA binding protein
MVKQHMSISQAAEKLGVSTRTIRRYIKAGRIKAELISGRFGAEYNIFKLPSEFLQNKQEEGKLDSSQSNSHTPSQTTSQALDIIRELQGKNLALAAQLGAATERVRNLENQVKLLTAAKMPWWKRLFVKRKS